MQHAEVRDPPLQQQEIIVDKMRVILMVNETGWNNERSTARGETAALV